MRHFDMKKGYFKYVLVDKATKKATIYRFRGQIASKIGVNRKTLERKPTYENDKFMVFMLDGFEN